MKKYLSILTALFAVLFTSCSNDDIPVMHETVFKVDPSTVISSYDEYYVGDLTALGSGCKLRIRLLVYNEDGSLVAYDEAFSNDYTHIHSFNFALAEGEYTTVAITDVIIGDFEYYTMTNQERLNTLQLTNTGYVGGQNNILGLTAESQYVTSIPHDINIKVKPAGALIICYIKNWNDCLKYTDSKTGEKIDIETYYLTANQISSDITLNSIGDPIYSIQTSTDFNYAWYIHERDSDYKNGYGYVFKFPMSNVKLLWQGVTYNEKRYRWGEPVALNIEANEEYYFELDMATDEATWHDLNINTRKSNEIFNSNTKNAKLNQNFNFMIKDEPVSIKAIDYLKKK